MDKNKKKNYFTTRRQFVAKGGVNNKQVCRACKHLSLLVCLLRLVSRWQLSLLKWKRTLSSLTLSSGIYPQGLVLIKSDDTDRQGLEKRYLNLFRNYCSLYFRNHIKHSASVSSVIQTALSRFQNTPAPSLVHATWRCWKIRCNIFSCVW